VKIWKKPINLDLLNSTRNNTLVEVLGINFTEFGGNYLVASMPVDYRTHQPMGILHGGASVALAETVGSVASYMVVDNDHHCVGLDINANHLKAVRSGLVFATAKPFHLGRSTHVWDIQIENEEKKPVCVSRLTMAVLKNK